MWYFICNNYVILIGFYYLWRVIFLQYFIISLTVFVNGVLLG